jgi:hypothetical protein
MSLVNLTPKETRKINDVLFFSNDAEPDTTTEEENGKEPREQ